MPIDHYNPQETTMNTYQVAESKFYHHLLEAGVTEVDADLAAKATTQFMLGYLTPHGAYVSMIKNGVDEELANVVLRILEEISDAPTEGKARETAACVVSEL